MDANIATIISAIGGGVTGAGVMYIAFRKLPGELRAAESQRRKNNAETSTSESVTIRNLLESNKLMSSQLKDQQKEITEMRAWLTGTIEVTTRLEMGNPPKAYTTVKRIPSPAADRA